MLQVLPIARRCSWQRFQDMPMLSNENLNDGMPHAGTELQTIFNPCTRSDQIGVRGQLVIQVVLLLGIYRRALCPSDTRGHPCALLLPSGHPAF
jgi:hypothetical protein